MIDLLDKNQVYLQGTVCSEPEFSHSVQDEDFYKFDMEIPRLSGKVDVLPITMSYKFFSDEKIHKGDKLALRGQFRSHNKMIDGKSRLLLTVFCREIVDWDDEANPNLIEITGTICQSPTFRVTPFNREICDIIIGSNRQYNKSDYIPCIAWGRDARFVSKQPIGTKLQISGRIQSREYNKILNEFDGPVIKIAYEVSVCQIAVIGNSNNDEHAL